MIRHYVFSLILMLGSAGVASPFQPGDQYVRPPEDVQRLQAILASVGVKPEDISAARATMTTEDAGNLLRDAAHAARSKDYSNSLEILKSVLAFDPDTATELAGSGGQTRALSELAFALWSLEDWERALPVLELCGKETRIREPNSDSMAFTLALECRRKLAEQGKVPSGPLIVVGQVAIGPPPQVRNGGIMVRARELADCLHLRITPDESDCLRITDGEGEHELRVWVGKQTAMAGKLPVMLRVPPERRGDDILLPLRAVAEHFGNSVTWEAGPQVAWVTRQSTQ